MNEKPIKYETKSAKAVRGRESQAIAKLERNGWEFVDQTTGRLSSKLTFRRPKPALNRSLLLGIAAVVVVGAAGLGIGALLEGRADNQKSAAAGPSQTPTNTSPAEPAAITVDELLDKLNSANLGGIEPGDRFRFSGELFEADAWGEGATGDYSVLIKAKGGADDLSVFVDQSDAAGWGDGTRVEMVVEAVKRTVDGETSDGWLETKSVKTLRAAPSADGGEGSGAEQFATRASTYAMTLNRAFDSTVIDSVAPGPGGTSIVVTLNTGVASLAVPEVQSVIKQLNTAIAGLADGRDATPILKYELAGDVVAENRYILDPEAVKFEGLLDE